MHDPSQWWAGFLVGTLMGWIGRAFYTTLEERCFTVIEIQSQVIRGLIKDGHKGRKRRRTNDYDLSECVETNECVENDECEETNETETENFVDEDYVKEDFVVLAPKEATDMFDDELERREKSTEEILQMGKNVGKEPIRYHTQMGGGYVTNSDLKNVSENHKEFKENKLSRADELEVISTFRSIEGMFYYKASALVEKDGYSLHPLYNDYGPKMSASVYNGTVLGVRINDSWFDYGTCTPSSKAKVVQIIDVGGTDARDRGKN